MFANQFKQVEQQILAILNNSGLPIAGAYYLIKSIELQLELMYEKAIIDEQNTSVTQDEEIDIKPYAPVSVDEKPIEDN